VFFTSRAELTNDAYTGPDDNAENLYEYDVETGILTDLTVDKADANGAAVLGVVTASESGSYVYFVAEGKLTTQANIENEEPTSGRPNLYLYHAGRTSFVATLASATEMKNGDGLETGGDASDWYGAQEEAETGSFNFGPGQHTARVTPDGTRLAFESIRSLTGYDNEQAGPNECGAGRCREVYLFDTEGDSGAGSLICASCDPSDARPVGPAELGDGEDARGTEAFGLKGSPLYLPRNLSENGGRLFFQSPDALVPQDSGGQINVYEWEAQGEGSCALAGGCTLPISDVAGGGRSSFMDATPTGEDVFIATRDPLVPAADADARANVYDVRVDGGFPVNAPPPTCTNADSCKPPVSPQPGVFGAPASATFSGHGNAAPSPPVVIVKPKPKVVKCKKGFVKKKVKKKEQCVKTKPKKRAKRASRDRGESK
jgi:hypothetical protein